MTLALVVRISLTVIVIIAHMKVAKKKCWKGDKRKMKCSMRMNELSLDERDLIDKLNKINKRLVEDENISLWNVAKAYLNNRIPRDILDRSKNEIIDILREIN